MRSTVKAGILLLTAAAVLGLTGCGEGGDGDGDGGKPSGGAATDSAPATPAQVGDKRPAFTLPDLDGEARSISEWDGQLVLINFWATWCPPCRREMPAFMQLRAQYKDQGFEVVGVAVDQPEPVRNFADELLIDYPILVGEQRGNAIMQRYGNRFGALPYSVLVGRDGHMVFRHRGELSKEEAEAQIKEHL